MIIKCKMCGGDIEFIPGETYGTCQYCGSSCTIPQADDEQKLNRYNRANHFRRQCEFDKALAAYEKILEQDETDAEAHWGAALSRYGIEYVEDPAAKKRIPTCHRLQVASILADADYLAAVENAPDAESRHLYEEQAAQIAEIQKGILAISANEKPYDVFICYKETDDNGQRTRDSQWAQDVYYGLTDEGYKVFFSRITLEDKLGRQYEPYIFAALNSARVMVLIGSRPEYFNAVWVKNEWSRYLALMAGDRTRLLIPCYRDMDPYDLPEELSALQSQDMSKIGFMQDLLRGVKKVLNAERKPEKEKAAPPQQAVDAFVTPSISSLMKRAYLFMEDGDFGSAGEYLDRVLDLDPEYAPAYAAKTCVTLELRREAELASIDVLYGEDTDWQKALRFANVQQKAVYEGYYAQVRQRVASLIRNYAYGCALEMAVNPNARRSELDKKLDFYRDVCRDERRSSGYRDMLAKHSRNDIQQNQAVFENAVRTNETGDVTEQAYKDAAEMFAAIEDDQAAECARQCLVLSERARVNQAAAAALAEREKERAAEELRKKLYDDAVRMIRDAGIEKQYISIERAVGKWREAKALLEREELQGYCNVAQLQESVESEIEECVKKLNRQGNGCLIALAVIVVAIPVLIVASGNVTLILTMTTAMLIVIGIVIVIKNR